MTMAMDKKEEGKAVDKDGKAVLEGMLDVWTGMMPRLRRSRTRRPSQKRSVSLS